MINLLASIIGIAGAIVYVGFFAYKVDAPPLMIIVACCLALMVYSFYDDWREARARAQDGRTSH
jgi:UDP-N-acetylmuramyl pentapeptide phosphotransferase/UDP-N-acetylglucosamine-1-phosphate transferase